MHKTEKQTFISITRSQQHGGIVIRREDRARFAAVVRQALAACRVRRRSRQAAFRKQFETLLGFLAQWVHQHKTRLGRAFLTTHDTGLVFLVVSKAATYDADLEYELTRLDLQIAHSKELPDICLGVQALPCCGKDSIEHFCPIETTLEFTDPHVE